MSVQACVSEEERKSLSMYICVRRKERRDFGCVCMCKHGGGEEEGSVCVDVSFFGVHRKYSCVGMQRNPSSVSDNISWCNWHLSMSSLQNI